MNLNTPMKNTLFKLFGVASLLCMALCSKYSELNAAEGTSAPIAAIENAEVRPGRGEDFNTGKFLVNFKPVLFRAKIGETEPAEGAVYVVIEFTYKNITKKPISALSAPSFFLKDESGTKYDPDVQANIAWVLENNSDEKVLSNINPRISIRGSQVFEIAREAILEKGWKVYVDAPSGDDDFDAPFEVYSGDFSVHGNWELFKGGISVLETDYLLSRAAAEKLMLSEEIKGSLLSIFSIDAARMGRYDLILPAARFEVKEFHKIMEYNPNSQSRWNREDPLERVVVYQLLSIKPVTTGLIYDYIVAHKDTEPKAYRKLLDDEKARAIELSKAEIDENEYNAFVASETAARTRKEAEKEAVAQKEKDARQAQINKEVEAQKAEYQASLQREREAHQKQVEAQEKHRAEQQEKIKKQQSEDKPDEPAAPDAAKDLDEAAAALTKALKKFPFGR
jgi:hypothetical protein